MEIIRLNDEELNFYASDFWHRSEWRDYCKDATFTETIDRSFCITDKNKIIAIVPLLQEQDQFTFQGGACPCVILEDSKYLYLISDEIKKQAQENGVKRILIDGFLPSFKHHVKQICISDLSTGQIRKSYKSLMKLKNNLTMDIVGQDSADIGGQIDLIKSFYYFVAKKVTRPEATFEHYKNWIAQGYMSLIMMRADNILVSFSLVTHYQKEAYYFMSATLPEYNSHPIQGAIFDLLKNKGVTDYVLGDIIGEGATEKEKAISFYKSGFGDPNRYKIVSEYIF